ncbi:MAG: histidine kinase [Bacteroidota bacterium]
MQLSSKQRNLIFWSLQILGWGSLNVLSAFILKKVSFQFLLFNVLIGIFNGILVTSLLRYYLKRKVGFDNFGLIDIGKIVLSTILAAIMYGGLNYGFGYLYGRYALIENEVDLEFLKNYDSIWLLIVNSLFIIFSWVFCYLVIKVLLKLNSNRIEHLELNSALKQAQLNTLKGQINPHFMFNSLNNIRGLMLEDVEKSRDMLTKLSEMLRYSLTKNDVDAIALEEELEMVDNYIDLSKIQLEDRLDFKKEIAPETLKLSIPPMIVQLLVENASKHGISNIKQGGRIVLNTKIDTNRLCIKVINTGKLKIAKGSTQLGLKNIRQRLRLLYGENAVFTLKEENGEVVANVKIPMP